MDESKRQQLTPRVGLYDGVLDSLSCGDWLEVESSSDQHGAGASHYSVRVGNVYLSVTISRLGGVEVRPVRKTPEVKFWTRESVSQDPKRLYVFGDNLHGRGNAGQACIRGLKNAHGIPTKNSPSMTESAFFSDEDIVENMHQIRQAFASLATLAERFDEVVFPKDGLGTGLAKLKEKAPKTYAFLQQKIWEFRN